MAETTLIKNYNFEVIVTGGVLVPFIKMGFSKISGLADETEIVEYFEGTDFTKSIKFPGRTTTKNVIFSRGITPMGDDLFNWRERIKKSGSLYSFNDLTANVIISCEAEPPQIFLLKNCWPSALEISDLDAMSSEVLIETMTLSVDEIEFL